MDTVSLDANAMNRFISSLSKSLQALCHGCMDFDSGIEMIGYININIDRENSVDCVLNEKVKRSSKTNSMTFVSNSFMARKEIAKVTCDASCSPIPECAQLQSEPRSTREGEHRSFSSRKRHSFIDSHRMVPSRKRHHRESSRTSHHGFVNQGQFQEAVSDCPENQVHESDYNVQNIKDEVDEGGSYSDPSSSAIKTENNDQESTLENLSSAEPSASLSHEPELVYSLPQSQFTSREQPVSPFNNQHLPDVEQSEGSAENSQNRDCSYATDLPNEQPSFLDEGEESSNAGQFEVIEIGDEDEEVQGIFAQSDDEQRVGGNSAANQQLDMNYSQSWPLASGNFSSSSSQPWPFISEGQGSSSQTARNVGDKFTCPHCSLVLESQYSFKHHILKQHNSALPFSCQLCGKGFLSNSGLKHHEMAHSGRNFPCRVCDQRFNQKAHLTRHLKIIHKLKVCQSCLELFKLENYNQHVLTCK